MVRKSVSLVLIILLLMPQGFCTCGRSAFAFPSGVSTCCSDRGGHHDSLSCDYGSCHHDCDDHGPSGDAADRHFHATDLNPNCPTGSSPPPHSPDCLSLRTAEMLPAGPPMLAYLPALAVLSAPLDNSTLLSSFAVTAALNRFGGGLPPLLYLVKCALLI